MDKILIIQGARFGDLLQTGRLVASLTGRNQVHLLIDASLVELARLVYPQAVVHGIALHNKLDERILARNEEVFRALRFEGYKAVYNCNFSSLTGSVARLFESRRVCGYRPAHDSAGGQLRSSWLRLAFRLSSRREAATLNLVDMWGCFDSCPAAGKDINPSARGEGRGIGVAVAGRAERRSIPPEVLALSIEVAARTLGAKSIKFFGTAQEEQKARRLERMLHPAILSRVTNLCGRTDWARLCDELRGLDLLITPDTGLMHLAARLGVPVLAFFLSSALCHETGPYGLGHYIWQSAPACAPCLESAGCQHDLSCAGMFRNPGFPRALAALLKGSEIPPLPDGLQLWKTGFDDLGQRLELVKGHDGHGRLRQLQRDYIREYLRLSDVCLADSEDRKKVIEYLEPISEWMLPPNRYCQ